MKDINIFCFGFGQVAKSFIKKLNLEKFNINLSVTSRDKTQQQKINKINYKSFQFVNDSFDQKLIEKLKQSEHILISIPPIDGFDLVVKNFSKIIEESSPKWITYLSATSVYGDYKGEWVNEESEKKPTSANGIDRLAAEKSWMLFAENSMLPFQIFRLSGIYSDLRNILARLKSGNTNIINVLFKSLSNFKSSEIYNISDDKPSSSKEVTLYGVKLLNVDIPKSIEIKDIESEMLKNFYKESKKVSNKKMKSFFDYNLKFPTYVEGLNYIRNNLI